jgi:hypothetical protein
MCSVEDAGTRAIPNPSPTSARMRSRLPVSNAMIGRKSASAAARSVVALSLETPSRERCDVRA